MEKKENLTNEKLRNKFTNQFELVSYAIKLAANMIRTGRAPRVKTETQNVPINVLSEISSGKDQLDEIDETPLLKNDHHIAPIIEVNGKDAISAYKTSERKKNRILH